jgi:adenosylcobinamide kinase / adenosylcobinamide-phosphate guanylyltransferase
MITLVLGGTRSGKSAYAERLMAQAPLPITYVATMEVGDDPDLALRVALHLQSRPGHWRTVEAGRDLVTLLHDTTGSVLVESLGPWVALHDGGGVDGAELCRALSERDGDTVVVSEEVGLGVHPSTEAGRRFRDTLGSLNQDVARAADRVLLVVAGRALNLDRGP